MDLCDFREVAGEVREGGCVLVDRYLLGGVLSVESTVETRRATERESGRPCACRLFQKRRLLGSDILRKLLRAETELLFADGGPHLLRATDAFQTAETAFLVVGPADCTLQDLLQRGATFSEEEAVRLLAQVADGLRGLRAQKASVRDLKPAGLLVREGRLAVGGLQFASRGADFMTVRLGTPLYMSPEMLLRRNGDGGGSGKMDLWSLGVVFFRLLFGDGPFLARSFEELKASVLQGSGPSLLLPRPVGPATEDLLRGLLTFGERERIGWDEFFEHPLLASPAARQAVGTRLDFLDRLVQQHFPQSN